MTTALDVIKRSMRMLGVLGIGETPSAEETVDGLMALNALIGTISNTGLVYVKSLDSIAVSAGTASITVGPSGGTVATRPVNVLGDSYFVIGDESYPLDLWTLQQYNAIESKASEGTPVGIWVKPDMPNVTITFYPVPNEALTLKLWSNKPITGTLAAATSLSLPPGYDDALAYLVAESIAPEYEKPITPDLMRGIIRSRKLLKRTNLSVPQLSLPPEIAGRPSADIRNG